MEKSSRNIERTVIKLIAWVSGGLVLLVLLCWLGSRSYQGWQVRTVLRRAATHLQAGDARAAGVGARRAYQLNPESADAARMLAEVAEAAAERVAVEWRREVVRMNPGAVEDQIALAKTAVKFEEYGQAANSLGAIPESAQNASFHAIAGKLADATRKPAEAQRHWRRATQLEPQNKEYTLQLAIAELNAPQPELQTSARAVLEAARKDPAQRAAATRALIFGGAAEGGRADEVVAFARELQTYPEATFNDVLLHLDILRKLRHADFTSFLTEAQEKAVATPNDLASLLSWMNKNSLSALAIHFARGLKSELLKPWPVPLALAESYSNVSDWKGLEQWTISENWGSYECLRRAYLARGFRGEGKTAEATREMNLAKKQAANQPRLLALLTRTIIEWRWTDDAVDLLWTLSKDSAEQHEALNGLYEHYTTTGDTAGLYRTLLRLVETRPGDLALQNNLAQIGLLLNAEPDRASELAARVYEKEPSNPAYTSTYAFSLFSKGKAAEAVRTMETLSPEHLASPEVAGYFGVFLAAAGDRERARKFLDAGAAARLLPEEKALVAQAIARL